MIKTRQQVVWIVAIVLVLVLIVHRFSTHEPADDLTINTPPKALLIKAVRMNGKTQRGVPHAIDFGVGQGNETMFLLENGFEVTAIDKENKRLSELQQHLVGKPYLNRLKTFSNDCENIDWQHISTTDFFLASFALPFCSPKNFQTTWQNIQSHIKPGGYFVGQFYDPSYQGLSWWQRKKMTFLTQKEVLSLFKGFNIKYLSRKREHHLKSGHSPIQAEYYEVIAQKKLD